MRLLKLEPPGWFNKTPKFSLTKFQPHELPQYAILSHRWGSDEVIYEDIENGNAKNKAGYRKLLFCAEQAARDGLVYSWIDSCCIDKRHSSELDEAINSMFQWYRGATKCYVYLSDVSKSFNRKESEWISYFEQSEWFMRGWTLQELIAPKCVEFYSVEGEKLGDKGSLEQRIHQITGIPIEALHGATPMSLFDTNIKKTWVERRKTTIDEDIVYCMFGLFDVHMPLIYGEGRKKAWARLQREIQLSFSPLPVSLKEPPWIVPFERNVRFVGQESQLKQLEERVFVTNQTARIAVVGLGGIGKTQLVLELLHRIKNKHTSCAVFWIEATNKETIRQSYIDIAQKLDLQGWDDGKADVKELVQKCLSDDQAGRWILVFDNADDINLWSNRHPDESKGVLECLPKGKQGSVVFTTRDRKIVIRLGLAQSDIVDMQEMSGETATQLLQSLVDSNLASDQETISELIAELTHLPLAIVQAAAFINENGINFKEYLTLLREREEDMIELLSAEFEDLGRYRNTRNPVATTWLISFERIKLSDPLAAEYLSFMACLEPKNIPQSLLPELTAIEKINAFGRLHAYSFIRKRSGQTLDLHRLVHLATRNWLRQEGTLDQWTKRAGKRLAEVLPDGEHKDRSFWRLCLPHVEYILGTEILQPDGWDNLCLLWKYGKCLYEDGLYREAAYQLILVHDKKSNLKHVIVGDHNNPKDLEMSNAQIYPSFFITAVINRAIGDCYEKLGMYDSAASFYQSALLPKEDNLKEASLDELHVAASLINIYDKQSRYEKAIALGMGVLEVLRTVTHESHPAMLETMHNLGLAQGHKGQFDKAEIFFLRVISIREELDIFGPNHPATIRTVNALANCYDRSKQYDKAVSLYKRAISARESIYGADHPQTLRSICGLANVYLRKALYQEARAQYQGALRSYEKSYVSGRPDELRAVHGIATVLACQKEYDKAEQFYQRAIDGRVKELGEKHADTLRSMEGLGAVYVELGQYHKAEKLFTAVYEGRLKTWGIEHPETQKAIKNVVHLGQIPRTGDRLLS